MKQNKIIVDAGEKHFFSVYCSLLFHDVVISWMLTEGEVYWPSGMHIFIWKFTIALHHEVVIFFNNRLNQPFVNQKHNTELLVAMVRQQFKKNMHETDPEKIQKMKDE